MLRKLLPIKRNVHTARRAFALHTAAIAGAADSRSRRSRRFCHNTEKLDEACAGQNHDGNKEKKDRENLRSNRSEARHKRNSKQTAEKARAAPDLSVAVKRNQFLPEGYVAELIAKDIDGSAQQNNNHHHEDDFYAHFAVVPVKRCHHCDIEQEDWPENSADAEQAHQLIMQPGPNVFTRNQNQAPHKDRYSKQYNSHDLIALPDCFQLAQTLLLLLRFCHWFFSFLCLRAGRPGGRTRPGLRRTPFRRRFFLRRRFLFTFRHVLCSPTPAQSRIVVCAENSARYVAFARTAVYQSGTPVTRLTPVFCSTIPTIRTTIPTTAV